MRMFGKSGASPEQEFWQWFSANSDSLAAVANAKEPVCDELMRRLQRVHRDLAFLFGPVKDGCREFIVSGCGIKAAFPAVQRLVAEAGDQPGWSVIAFKPRIPLPEGMALKFGTTSLGIGDIFYSATQEGPLLNVNIHIRNVDACDDQVLAHITFLMLDAVLGEFDVATRIGKITWHKLLRDPVSLGLKPLVELPAELETLPRRN